jgi:uncharacterized membrane protein
LRTVKLLTQWLSAALAALVAGTVVHEVIGHGLAATALGGHITQVVILGLQVYPSLEFVGWPIVSGYGSIDYDGAQAFIYPEIIDLAGSLSTWLVAVGANLVLWTRRRWQGWPKVVLVLMSIYWMDLLTYTLPSWGIPRSILWGQSYYSEPYQAAVGLGLDGNVFRAFVMVTSGAMLLSLVLHVRRSRRQRDSLPESPDK